MLCAVLPCCVLCMLCTAAQDWHMHGLFAKAAVNGLCELYYLIGSREALPENSRPLLEGLHGAFAVLVTGSPQGAVPGQQQAAGAALAGGALDSWRDLGGRLHERISRAIISHLDNFPIPFAGEPPLHPSPPCCPPHPLRPALPGQFPRPLCR
jgi:hypothetical protein